MLEVKRKTASHSHGAAAPAPARVHKEVVSERMAANNDQHGETQQLHSNSAREIKDFHPKLPVITGEVHFRGALSVDGLLSGQVGSNSGLNLKQRPSPSFNAQAELVGEFSFKDMVRVNGHIAGRVYSQRGTMIVDSGAKVEANVDVAVAMIGGTVTGDIVGRERVELGPASRIYGNIRTRSLVIKDGAIFEGVCCMIGEEH
jgi:cytoskeletal protein CcmA (bactofilin family)